MKPIEVGITTDGWFERAAWYDEPEREALIIPRDLATRIEALLTQYIDAGDMGAKPLLEELRSREL